MCDDEIDSRLEQIRERRLRAYKIYELALEDKKRAQDEYTREQLDKQSEMLRKAFVSLDKAMDRVEKRVQKVRALRLQLGLPQEQQE